MTQGGATIRVRVVFHMEVEAGCYSEAASLGSVMVQAKNRASEAAEALRINALNQFKVRLSVAEIGPPTITQYPASP